MRLLLRAVCAMGMRTLKPVVRQTARFITRPATPTVLKPLYVTRAHAQERCVHWSTALCRRASRGHKKHDQKKVGPCGKRLRHRRKGKKGKKGRCIKNPTICYQDLKHRRKHNAGPCCPCKRNPCQDRYRRQ